MKETFSYQGKSFPKQILYNFQIEQSEFERLAIESDNNKKSETYNSNVQIEENLTTINSRKERNKKAAAMFREKQKQYLKELQENVADLQTQLTQTEAEVISQKDKILRQLEKNKLNGAKNENEEIFTQLIMLVQQESIEADFDKIDLLLDTLKSRIGVSGRERQAKISYYFKNVIHTIYPAIYRYFIDNASKQTDLFSPIQHPEYALWTKELYDNLQLNSVQIQQFSKFRPFLTSNHTKVLKLVEKLKKIKESLKEEEIVVEGIENNLRQCMNPVQCGRWSLFCEKHKYKEEIFLDKKFIQKEEEGRLGRKKVKKQQ